MKKNLPNSLVVMLLLLVTFKTYGQQQISLQDIWSKRTFSPEMVYGVNPLSDGKTYAILDDDALNVYDFTSGELVKTWVDLKNLIPEGATEPIKFYSYELSPDEQKMLIPTDIEAIYRHSSKATFFVYDFQKKTLTPLSDGGKQQLASFSPDGMKVAFARDNNLFIKNLLDATETQITFDGETNNIINGTTDWVYEEEFSFTKAFFWSPNSQHIAYIRFDESDVKEFQMTFYGSLYPENYKYKYPKAGESNSLVSVQIYALAANKTTTVDLGENTDIYIPRIQWTQNPEILSIQRLNRHQNHFEILLASATTGTTTTAYQEKSEYYVDITDNLYFLPDAKHYILTSEKDGFNHIYLHQLDNNSSVQLTKGSWDVTKLYGYSAKEKKIYFQSADVSPMDRTIHSVDLKGNIKTIMDMKGQNDALFSTDYSAFINTNSTINSPYYISVQSTKGKKLRVLKDNADLAAKVKAYNAPAFEFFTIDDPSIVLPNGENVVLNAWKIVPPQFDSTKKYPVLIYIYGGPGAQTVNNSWGGSNSLWFQHLAQKGIIVISVDNRGTGARGSLFKKMTYKELGKYETEDLITTAKFMSKFNYVDAQRIAVFGWSYGGYMASLGITKGADYFKAAIAVAPVTNWRYYDNIYTERYMRLPSENADGYDLNSPINHVEKIKGNYLLVHGSGDDNVHYQNTMEMINALVKANKQFDLMIYPNRNHGIYGGSTRLNLYQKMDDFLEKNLLNNDKN